MNKPYRELALMPAQPAELAPLVPFRTAQRGSPCPKCLAGERTREELGNQPAIVITGGVCIGRRVGLCRAGCREERPHFHARCRCCGSRWLMATADTVVTSVPDPKLPAGVTDTGSWRQTEGVLRALEEGARKR